MKTKTIKLAMATALALAANALFAAADSYIYWMVDSTEASSYTYTYATIKVDGQTSYLHMYDPGTDTLLTGDDAAGTKLAKGDSGYFGVFDASAMTGSSFLIELWNGGEGPIAEATLAYATALAGGSIYTPGTTGGATASAITGFTAVPEPTSGLLMLLGMAGLALRRKRTA